MASSECADQVNHQDDAPPTPRIHKLEFRLGPTVIEQIVEDYCAGFTSTQLMLLPVERIEPSCSFSRLSFPLNAAGGFAGDVEDYAVDLGDFIGYAGRDRGEDVIRQTRPVGGHGVLA